MTQIAKLYQKLLEGRRLTFAEFERLMHAFGFELDRQRGSHRVYRHPAIRQKVNVQPTGKNAKDYQLRQFLDIVEELGLSLGED